jgi:hypothetical protein
VVRGTPPSRQLVVRSSAISLLLPRDDKTEQYVASGVLIWLSDCTATCTGSRGAVEQSVSLKCLWVCSVGCENALLRIRARARSHTHTANTHSKPPACRCSAHQTRMHVYSTPNNLLSAFQPSPLHSAQGASPASPSLHMNISSLPLFSPLLPCSVPLPLSISFHPYSSLDEVSRKRGFSICQSVGVIGGIATSYSSIDLAMPSPAARGDSPPPRPSSAA